MAQAGIVLTSNARFTEENLETTGKVESTWCHLTARQFKKCLEFGGFASITSDVLRLLVRPTARNSFVDQFAGAFWSRWAKN